MLARLQNDLKDAMKARDELRTSVLRMLISDLKNEKIKLMRGLQDEEVAAILKRSAKRRDEAAAAFEKGGRADLAEKERKEKTILEAYMPVRMPDEEMERIVAEAVQSLGATSPKDAGRVIGAVMKAHGARADGNAVRAAVNRKLGAS